MTSVNGTSTNGTLVGVTSKFGSSECVNGGIDQRNPSISDLFEALVVCPWVGSGIASHQWIPDEGSTEGFSVAGHMAESTSLIVVVATPSGHNEVFGGDMGHVHDVTRKSGRTSRKVHLRDLMCHVNGNLWRIIKSHCG